MAESASLDSPTLTPVGRQAGAPTFPLTQPITIAGSSSRAELRMEAKSVSRFHCIIFRSGREVFMRDLASRNGTFVNKNRIAERTLHGGDIIHIGDRPFQFRRCGTRNLSLPQSPDPARLAGDDWDGIAISGKTLLIGRREGCDVILDGDDVAPVHAILFAIDGAHQLLDLHSHSGTRLNGEKLDAARVLWPGDEIEIAGTIMRYEPACAAAPNTNAPALGDSDAPLPLELDIEPTESAPAIVEPAAIADQEESMLFELDGAVSPADEAPAVDTTPPAQPVEAAPEEPIAELTIEPEIIESSPPPQVDLTTTENIVAAPTDIQATFPPEAAIMPPAETSPESTIESAEMPAIPAAAPSSVEFDFNDFNALIDSLGEPPSGVSVNHAAAPLPAVQTLAPAEVANAIRADVGDNPPVPQRPPPPHHFMTGKDVPPFIGSEPATPGKVTVGFALVSPPARDAEVFSQHTIDSQWKAPPDPGFGVASPDTMRGASPASSASSAISVPEKQIPESPRVPIANRRSRAGFWIVLLLVGSLVIFWSHHLHHSAGDRPVISPPAQDDAQRASMRQTP